MDASHWWAVATAAVCIAFLLWLCWPYLDKVRNWYIYDEED